MKKTGLAILCIFLILSLAACGEAEKTREIYDSFSSMEFDESLLGNDELLKINSFKDQREEMLNNSDVEGITRLKDEWEAFIAPINAIIEQYESAKSSLISEDDKAFLTNEELTQNNDLAAKIKSAFDKRDAAALTEATKEYESAFKSVKDVLSVYHSLSKPSFSEKETSILPKNDIKIMDDLSQKTENALKARDLNTLKSLGNKWNTFANSAKSDLEKAKDELLDKWLSGANWGSSFSNFLSFGTTTTSTKIEGHKIFYTVKYNIDYDSRERVEAAMGLIAPMCESGVKQLKPYIDDVCIRIEYLDKGGSIICYKEFN